MGLDIHPGGARWAYSGFTRFRERLAEAEGLDLWEMEGFADAPDWMRRNRGTGGPTKPWARPDGSPITPLEPLLNHSDCDGYLDPSDCEQALPRLKQIVETWEDGDYDKEHGGYLIAGMLHVIRHRCAMRFG